MFDLTGKKALITGASGGIGQALAHLFSRQGAEVLLSGTRVEALEALKTSLYSPDKAHVLPARLDIPEDLTQLCQKVESLEGVDILIHNAGVTRDNLLLRLKDDDWEHVLRVNLNSLFHLSRALVKSMMRQRFGRIIALSSVVGITGNAGQANYTASKAGMIGFIKSLALEVASRGITANAIAPGFIETPMTADLPDEVKEKILTQIPQARMGRPEDIAYAALFLASTEASYMTGQTLHMNGGLLRA